MKKVCARTISSLTARAADPAMRLSPAPDREALIKALCDRADNAAAIRDFLADVPEGFALAPVLYTRVPHQQNSLVEAEYLMSVRADFLRFLGETQVRALRDLGFCEHAIDRMKRGLEPATRNGAYYRVSIDHIVERAGGGSFSTVRSVDSLRARRRRDQRATYEVNHFSNLILLPDDVHGYKNRLNVLQGIDKIQPGESRWILMLVPLRTQQSHGYVCPPQPRGRHLGRLSIHRGHAHQRRADLLVLTQDAIAAAAEIDARFAVASALQRMEKIAQSLHPPAAANDGKKPAPVVSAYRQRVQDVLSRPVGVADIALAPRCGGRAYQGARRRLLTVFNTVAARPQTEAALRQEMTEKMDSVRAHLVACYQEAVDGLDTRRGQERYRQFVSLFEGLKMRVFCYRMSQYPLPGALALLVEYRRIAADIKKRQARARPHLSLPGRKTA